MKTFLVLALLVLLPGCTAMSMLGVGPSDVLPSLKYCDEVQYARSGTNMEIRAICKVPTG